jgi:hypothetical protein
MPIFFQLPTLPPSAILTSTKKPESKAPKLTFINSAKDVQLYLKPKYNLVRTWDQEFGIQAVLARYGNLSQTTNFADDPLYPINFNKKPRFTVGFQVTYSFTSLPTKLGVYTKTKELLIGPWKQESGITGRLFTAKSFYVTANLAYVYNYPYKSGQKPQWLSLINIQVPLGR